MRKGTFIAIAGLTVAAAACKDSTGVGNLNAVTADALASGLTRSSTQLLVTGLVNLTRANMGLGFVVFTETMARDVYRLDPNEPRYITETLGGLSDGSGFVGGGVFAAEYGTIRSGNTILNGLPGATGLTAAEKTAVMGFVEAQKALAYYRLIQTRDSLGIAVDVNHPITDPPAPFVCKPNALLFVSQLLDTAKTNLQAAVTAGTAFPFILPSGYKVDGDFTTPAAMLQFASGLQGEIELYRTLDVAYNHTYKKPTEGSAQNAINLLTASYLSTASPTVTSLAASPYNQYSTASGEVVNPIADVLIYVNPAVTDSINAGDLRAAKFTAATTNTRYGVSSSFKPTASDPTTNLTTPLPILKNAELILLRAQAELELNTAAGNAAALSDLNVVRTVEGGLAPRVLPVAGIVKDSIRAYILYEKRYSLFGLGPQRFVDLRAYNQLNATFHKPEVTGDFYSGHTITWRMPLYMMISAHALTYEVEYSAYGFMANAQTRH